MCDAAFVVLSGRMERTTLADMQALAVFKAAGHANELDFPSVEASLAAFEAALASPPVELSPQLRQLRELGLVA